MNENDETRIAVPQPATNPPDAGATLTRPLGTSLSAAGAVPGFEIEATLGRGAFGVVYKARQAGLNRDVALKMLLAGPYAGAAARARFLIEAEAVAALEHPHIVRVFAYGDHDGHPYLAMEFVPGGTLADRVKGGGPLPAAGATELVAKLAAAVAHAHSRGVVHRDIKPHNVLLTSDGEPRLTDFGLAKVGRSDMTMTGQVLGTPAYMAPEQAAGKVREVGTHSDVYALGAVLYDALVGRPPFLGDSAAVTLQKVIAEEPERPRALVPSVPRDLETICLKCLEKEPSRRYATAQALADDLCRYLTGEPIGARAAGALERGYRWVKRNRVVSGATAAVFLALVTGAGASTYGLLEARKQKNDAEGAAKREEDEKKAAVAARNELKDKIDELTRERGQRNRTLAKALLGPITLDNPRSLTRLEVEALWQLTELRRNEVSWMTLEEAVRTPMAREQLAHRVEYLLHAAIGLDAERRNAAEQLLLARLNDSIDRGQGDFGLARAVSESGLASPEAATVAARYLSTYRAAQGGNTEHKVETIEALPAMTALAAAAARMKPAEASRLCTTTAHTLADELADPKSFVRQIGAHIEVAKSVATLAAQMEPEAATHVCDRAARALVEDKGLGTNNQAVGLTILVPWMKPAAVDEICGPIAARLADEIVREQHVPLRDARTRRLAALAARMSSDAADDVCSRTADTLMAAAEKEMNESVRTSLFNTLARLCVWMKPERASRVLRTGLAKTSPLNLDTRGTLLEALVEVTAHIEPAEAARILIDVLTDTLTFLDRSALGLPLARGLVKVTARLKPSEEAEICARAAQSFISVLDFAFHPVAVSNTAKSLALIATRMSPTAAAEVCTQAARTFATRLSSEKDYEHRRLLTEALVAVVAHIELGEAARVLSETLAKSEAVTVYPDIVRGLVAVTDRMGARQAAEIRTNAARVLVDMLDGERGSSSTRYFFALALTELSMRLEPAVGIHIQTRAAFLHADQFVVSVFDADTVENFSIAVSGLTTADQQRRRNVSALAAGAFATPYNVPSSLPLVHPHFHPQPRPLPPQDLVELLKHPFCIGEARRTVLDALAFTYNRPFKDQWEFVEYAQKHQPQLDLLTPPKRPEAKP